MTELADWIPIWTALFGLLATALMVVVSALIERSGPIRLRHWAEHAGGRLNQLYSNPRRFVAYRFLLSLLAKLSPVVFAVSTWEILRRREVPGGPWIVLALVILVLGVIEWFNRFLVERHAEAALARSSLVLRALAVALIPFVWCLALITLPAAEEQEEDEDAASDDEIEAYIDVGVREGILEPEEEELVRSIVDFGDTQVRSVMTPRVEIKSAPVEADFEELARRFFESKHSRLPLYRESIDHIVGILHIRDVFETLHNGAARDVVELSHTPLYVPETKPLRDLLTEMQSLHQQMAIVVDEYGGVAGLVTVEDLVEEIVGEISDEHEPHEPELEKLGEHRWRISGRTYLEDLEEIFDVDSDDMPYETVSGLICGQLGYVPKAGEVLKTHGLVFTIEDADERRVTQVQVHPAPIQEASAQG